MNSQINFHNNPLDVLHVNSRKVSCDGGKNLLGYASGHPTIYLNMGKKNSVSCPYCSKSFSIERNLASLALKK